MKYPVCYEECADIIRESVMTSMDEMNERCYDADPDPEIGDCKSAIDHHSSSYSGLLQTLAAIRELSKSHDGTLASAIEAHDQITRISAGAIYDVLPRANSQLIAESKEIIGGLKRALRIEGS